MHENTGAIESDKTQMWLWAVGGAMFHYFNPELRNWKWQSNSDREEGGGWILQLQISWPEIKATRPGRW